MHSVSASMKMAPPNVSSLPAEVIDGILHQVSPFSSAMLHV